MLVESIPSVIPYPVGPPRTEGVHLSRVIRSMAASYGILEASWVEDLQLVEVGDGGAWWDGLDEVSKLRMSMGLAWEQFYLPLLGNVVHQPGEMCMENIFMTHDGESLEMVVSERRNRYVLACHEVKVTYKSTNTVADFEPSIKNWLWAMQIKGYCHGLNTLLAYLHVLFPCGDYSYPIQPLLKVWRIQFEQKEVDEAWALITSFRDSRLAQEREDAMKDTEDAL